MKFYLGTHRPRWLATLDVPLFVSRRTLASLRTPPRARAQWALDSGGFTELTMHGRWTVSAADYAREVQRLRAQRSAAWSGLRPKIGFMRSVA
jgi:hypothetical protein